RITAPDLRPCGTDFKSRDSRPASTRSLKGNEQSVPPIFEAKEDYEIIYLLAAKLGIAEPMFKNIKVDNNIPSAEDTLREINRGGWSTGYTGQSPERLKAHMKNQAKFDLVTLRAPKDDPEVGGDYYGLPWPCWGTPELRHPGTHTLYNTNLHVKDSGWTVRSRFCIERNGVSLLADGSYSLGSDIKDGYPEFTLAVLRRLGWDKELTPQEMAVIQQVGGNKMDAVSWATDLSGGIQRVVMDHGCLPYGNAKARAVAWDLPGPGPVRREPGWTPGPRHAAQDADV